MLSRRIANYIVAAILTFICGLMIFGNFDKMSVNAYGNLSIGLFSYIFIEFVAYYIFDRSQIYTVIFRLLTVLATTILLLIWQNKYLLWVLAFACCLPILTQLVLNLRRSELRFSYQDTIEIFLPILLALIGTVRNKTHYIVYSVILLIYVYYGVINSIIYRKRKERKENEQTK